MSDSGSVPIPVFFYSLRREYIYTRKYAVDAWLLGSLAESPHKQDG